MENSLAPLIEKFTASISNFDTSRDYLSMSQAALSVEEMIRNVKHGFEDSLLIRLRCYKGYQMEKDLMNRIIKLFPTQAISGGELTAYNGLVKGHPDFWFEGYPADCKAVPLDEHLPVNGKVSRKIYSQMQTYMMYANRHKALVVFESRESGRIADFWLRENKSVQEEIDRKFGYVVQSVGHLIRKQVLSA